REGRGSAGGTAAPAAAAQVVGEDELAERPALGLEPPATFAPSDLLHEAHEAGVVVEHEDVDRRAPTGAALDLGQRGRDRLAGGGRGEVGEAVGGQVGSRLAVGDHQDDRLGAAVFVQVAPGEHQTVL